MTSAFDRVANVTASTKRPPAVSSGKRGAPVAHLASLKCTPLDPVDAEIRQRVTVESPHELLQTFVDRAADILPGDLLVVMGKEYPIRSVADWGWGSSSYRHLVVEDLKT